MTFSDAAVIISASLLSVSAVLAFVRLILGPSLPDRVVALDLMSTIGIGAIGIYTIAMQEPLFLDVAIVLALVAFLGVIAFAYYIGKRGAERSARMGSGSERCRKS